MKDHGETCGKNHVYRIMREAGIHSQRSYRRVLIHSDQGVQYTCTDWRRFVSDNNLGLSMSRRSNCHDNAVAKSFFSLLKTERIKRRIYKTRCEARVAMFDYIELFYNPSQRHDNNGAVSPVEFEKQYYEKLSTV
jgi:putative transposase